MSKILIVMRHGQAANESAGGDRERALTDAGRLTAKQVGRELADDGYAPQLVLCSSARRAGETWEQVSAGLEACSVRRLDRLYGAGVETVLDLLAGVDDALESVMLVGHNPTLSEFVRHVGDQSTSSGPLRPGDTVVFASERTSWADPWPGKWRITARFGGR